MNSALPRTPHDGFKEYLEPAIRSEYERWCKLIGTDDPYDTPSTLGMFDVLRAHFLIADHFYSEGYGMGGIGPKDLNMLHSALYRQFVGYSGTLKWRNEFEVCATLTYGIIKDHPFQDANKRTALLSAVYYLYKKKRRTFTVSHRDIEQFMVEIAEDNLSNHSRFEVVAKRHQDEKEVAYIADFFRRNTRELSHAYYTLSYRELETLLRKFGFYLLNPKDNHIDVVQYYETRNILGLFGKKVQKAERVTVIAFPGWKRQVPKGVISKLRRDTRLTPQHGIDSHAFYHGADSMQAILDFYHAPLRRLADR